MEEANSSENTKSRKVDALYNELKIEDNPILQKNPEVKEKVKKLVKKFKDVFAEPGQEVEETDLIEFDRELLQNTRPHKSSARLLNPAQRKDLRRQLDQWLEQNVIEPSVLPCATLMASYVTPQLWKSTCLCLRTS